MNGRQQRFHFVPRFYLEGFRATDADGRIYVFPLRGATWRDIPERLCWERDYYRVDGIEGIDPLAFERQFADFEGRAAEAVRATVAARELARGDDYNTLMNFIALMASRVPQARDASDRVHEALERAREHGRQLLEAHGRPIPERREETPAERQARTMNALFIAHEAILRPLANRNWSLIIAGPGEHFVTSDHPVYLGWSVERGPGERGGFLSPGFALPETEVVFPLHPTLALYGDFEHPGIVREADQELVGRTNARQVMNAMRYVLSSQPDFRWRRSPDVMCSPADLPAFWNPPAAPAGD